MSNDKRAALIAEGLSEGEADFMVSGGTKSEGLSPTSDGGAAAPPEPGGGSPAPAHTEVREGGAAAPAAPAGPAASPSGTPPATPPAGEDEDDADLPQNTPVPYQRFKREKDRAKRRIEELSQQLGARDGSLAEMQQKWARLDERLSIFRQAAEESVAEATHPPAAPPDPEADPFGYMRHLGAQLEGLLGKTTQVETRVQERDAATQLESAYTTDARNFARATPDFGQSYVWLMRNRDAELAAAGYADPQERARIILADERDIVARALKARSENPQAPGPSQVLYGLAKARGFQPQPAPAPAAGNGGAAPPRPAAPANGETVTAQVEAIARGQAASRSLSQGGGAPAPAALDLAKLSEMSDEEFTAWRQALSPAQFKEYSAMLGAPGR